MAYTPTHLKPYERPGHYFGATWEGWYPVLGQTRDSDTLTRSNYRVALARLREVAKGHETDHEDPTERLQTVLDTRCNHWACGWIETIYVWAGDDAAVEAADSLLESLEGYPVLCEEDWGNLESEEAARYWEGMGIRERMEWCERYRVSIFAARRDEVPEDPTGELTAALAA